MYNRPHTGRSARGNPPLQRNRKIGKKGSAIAQEISRLFPTAAALVRTLVRLYGICGGQSGIEAGVLRVRRFSLSVIIPLTAPHSSLSAGAGTMGPLVADVPCGLGLTPPQGGKKLSKVIPWCGVPFVRS
jgi:hypothetical protein